MPHEVRIRPLASIGEPEIQGLSEVLIDCVENGASVSFMWPMTRTKAETFWRNTASSVMHGERMVMIAEDATGIIGTVTVIWAQPENQPHRGEIAKMLVQRRARWRGIGAGLLAAAEQAALQASKTLLVLDTVTDTDAFRLYQRMGWQRCGEIPNYALWPDGRPCPTTVFYKLLNSAVIPNPQP